MNGKKIAVSQTGELRNALCATGFPYEKFQHLDRYFNTVKFLFQNSHGVRRLGSAAVDMVYVACGRFDAFYEYNLNPWDIAAGIVIVKEAGGTVVDFSGGENYLFGKEIAAANRNLISEFLEKVNNPPAS
jgi:myo-inositol-1(or 4)-monophosphatase